MSRRVLVIVPPHPDAAPALDDLETASVQASVELAGGAAKVSSAQNRVGAEGVNAWLPDFGVGAAIVNHGAGVEAGPAIRIGRREVVAGSGSLSTIRRRTPSFVSHSAKTRPDGPAPTMRTSV